MYAHRGFGVSVVVFVPSVDVEYPRVGVVSCAADPITLGLARVRHAEQEKGLAARVRSAEAITRVEWEEL